MSHWPEDWARRGDGHTIVSRDPRKAMSLSFRAIIEGSHYDRKVEYVPVDSQPLEGEYLAMHIHTESYPSGGSVEYAKFSYWDGMKWQDDGEWRHSGPRNLQDPAIQWFAVKSQ